MVYNYNLNAAVDTYEKATKEYTNCTYEIMDHLDETATKAEEQNLEAIEGDAPDYSSEVYAVKRVSRHHDEN